MKDLPKMSDRFELVKKLGQGTFSFIYEAVDRVMGRNMALKIEKKDKNRNILVFEYKVLKHLKDLKHVCNVYDFIRNDENVYLPYKYSQEQHGQHQNALLEKQSYIVMDLLG